MSYSHWRALGILFFAFSIILTICVISQGCGQKTGIESQSLQHSYPSPSKAKVSSTPTVASSKDPAEKAVTTKVFFANEKEDPEVLKPEVTYPVVVPISAEKDEEIARKALEQLVKGPPVTFKERGFYTTLPNKTRINSVRIEGDTVYADFGDEINKGGGSCDMDQRRSQIENTLMNIPGRSIKKVVISVNGDTQNVLQP